MKKRQFNKIVKNTMLSENDVMYFDITGDGKYSKLHWQHCNITMVSVIRGKAKFKRKGKLYPMRMDNLRKLYE